MVLLGSQKNNRECSPVVDYKALGANPTLRGKRVTRKCSAAIICISESFCRFMRLRTSLWNWEWHLAHLLMNKQVKRFKIRTNLYYLKKKKKESSSSGSLKVGNLFFRVSHCRFFWAGRTQYCLSPCWSGSRTMDPGPMFVPCVSALHVFPEIMNDSSHYTLSA